MRNPLLKAPIYLSIIILIISGAISFFFLLFGLAHVFEGFIQLMEGTQRDIPKDQVILGWTMVTLFCLIGGFAALITIAALRSIINKVKGN